MSHLVKFEYVIVAERFAAYVAGVRLLTRMGPVVHLELLGTGEPLAAILADVRLLTGVRPHVYYQLTALNEGLRTDPAFVRALTSVYPHVAVQFTAVLERSFTDVAFIRPFFGVDPSMYAQIFLDGEGFLTILALVGLLAGVGTVMPRQTRGHRECLTAEITLVRVFALFRLVAPQVVLKGVLLGEGLVAKGTLEHLVRRRGRGRFLQRHGQIRATNEPPDRRLLRFPQRNDGTQRAIGTHR